MTTAARPTYAYYAFNPAVGGTNASDKSFPTQSVGAKQLTAHTKLKLRQDGQFTEEELQRKDFREELAKAEQEHREKKRRQKEGGAAQLTGVEPASDKQPAAISYEQDKDDDADSSASDSEAGSKRDGSDDDSSDDDDDEDDTAELMRELDRIRRERAEEKERQEQAKAELEQQAKEDAILKGNPLMNVSAANANFSVKRRWDDDVIFKNQAKVEEKPQKRFINDTLRSDFHRKFLSKYVK
ncbi:hypothetical protein RI367_001890 [Sorochytrium milnesiophthora]